MVRWYNNTIKYNIPDSKVYGTNMGLIWGQQAPGEPHVGPMNFAIWDDIAALLYYCTDNSVKI